jgi:hypothetical protein
VRRRRRRKFCLMPNLNIKDIVIRTTWRFYNNWKTYITSHGLCPFYFHHHSPQPLIINVVSSTVRFTWRVYIIKLWTTTSAAPWSSSASRRCFRTKRKTTANPATSPNASSPTSATNSLPKKNRKTSPNPARACDSEDPPLPCALPNPPKISTQSPMPLCRPSQTSTYAQSSCSCLSTGPK